MMAVRSRSELRRLQESVLDALRASRGVAGPSRFAGEESGALVERGLVETVAKVTSVVASDAELGPHLVVAAQHFSGKPPMASPASRGPQVAYPSPGRVVGDYGVDEFVRLSPARGALLALKLA
jgi:hypothetical protein